MMPRAVLKLRQGLGRLIRSRSDKGLMVITDRRLKTTAYGAVFRKSLPVPVLGVGNTGELVTLCKKWWAGEEIV